MASKETKTLEVPGHEDIKLLATHEPDGFETWDGMLIDPCWRGNLRRVSTGELLLDDWGEVYTFGHATVEQLLDLAS